MNELVTTLLESIGKLTKTCNDLDDKHDALDKQNREACENLLSLPGLNVSADLAFTANLPEAVLAVKRHVERIAPAEDAPAVGRYMEGGEAKALADLAVTRNDLEAARKELAGARLECEASTAIIDAAKETLGSAEGEFLQAAARRVVAERDDLHYRYNGLVALSELLQKQHVCDMDVLRAERGTLRTENATLTKRMNEIRVVLQGAGIETATDAAVRVMKEREDAVSETASYVLEIAELRAKLAARDELRDAAVEFTEAEMNSGGRCRENLVSFAESANPKFQALGRAGLRYLAAKAAHEAKGGAS